LPTHSSLAAAATAAAAAAAAEAAEITHGRLRVTTVTLGCSCFAMSRHGVMFILHRGLGEWLAKSKMAAWRRFAIFEFLSACFLVAANFCIFV